MFLAMRLCENKINVISRAPGQLEHIGAGRCQVALSVFSVRYSGHGRLRFHGRGRGLVLHISEGELRQAKTHQVRRVVESYTDARSPGGRNLDGSSDVHQNAHSTNDAYTSRECTQTAKLILWVRLKLFA